MHLDRVLQLKLQENNNMISDYVIHNMKCNVSEWWMEPDL